MTESFTREPGSFREHKLNRNLVFHKDTVIFLGPNRVRALVACSRFCSLSHPGPAVGSSQRCMRALLKLLTLN